MEDKARRGRWKWAALLLVTALIVSMPLFSAHHIIQGWDILFHLGRIEGIKEGLLSGQFPVRINSVQLGGYGMPSGIFYPGLPFYPPALLRIIGVPLAACWKAYMIGCNLLTVFAAWWAFSVFLRSWKTGAVAALFYEIFLYRLFELYLASAASSIFAMAFFPAALAAVWATLRRAPGYWPTAVIFSTLVLSSHVLTSIFLVISTGILLACSIPRLRIPAVRQAVGWSVAFIFLLNIWFYAPLLYFHRHMEYPLKEVTQQDVHYWQIFPMADLDFYMGVAMLFLIGILAIAMLLRRRQEPGDAKVFFLLSGVSLVMIWAMSEPAVWHMIGKPAGILQFPLRLSVFPAMFLSMAAAIGLKCKHYGRMTVLCLAICLANNFLWLRGYENHAFPLRMRSEQGFSMNRLPTEEFMARLDFSGYEDYMDKDALESIRRSHGELQDYGAKKRARLGARGLHPADRVISFERNGTDVVMRYAAGQEGWVQLPVFWYDGYVAEDDAGARCSLKKDDDAQVSVWLPPAAGTVHAWYRGLPWFCVTDALSLISGMIFIAMGYRGRRRSSLMPPGASERSAS